MKKIVHPCDVLIGTRQYPLFCQIEIDNGRLSISGVIGPTKGGNARGGCGQIEWEFAHRNPEHNDPREKNPTTPSRFAKGWDVGMWYDFLEIWHLWHLNDMRAGCEHQVGPEWTPKEVTLYHFQMTREAERNKQDAENAALSALRSGTSFEPSPEETLYALLPYRITLSLPAEASKYYEPDPYRPSKVESTGWLHENEHPEGFLGKACPVCGYKYGSGWRKVELPQTVIDFLQSLPDTDRAPNWV